MGFNRVNPPKQVVLPESLNKDNDLKKAFDDVYYILFQLWQRTGAGADWIDETRTGLFEFDDLEKTDIKSELVDDLVTSAVNYTTKGDQTVICTNAITVFLNETPDDRELVKVLITIGDVTVDSGSRLINNLPSVTIDFSALSTIGALDIVYTIETDSWWII